jgi:hypothetical protein
VLDHHALFRVGPGPAARPFPNAIARPGPLEGSCHVFMQGNLQPHNRTSTAVFHKDHLTIAFGPQIEM